MGLLVHAAKAARSCARCSDSLESLFTRVECIHSFQRSVWPCGASIGPAHLTTFYWTLLSFFGDDRPLAPPDTCTPRFGFLLAFTVVHATREPERDENHRMIHESTRERNRISYTSAGTLYLSRCGVLTVVLLQLGESLYTVCADSGRRGAHRTRARRLRKKRIYTRRAYRSRMRRRAKCPENPLAAHVLCADV